MYNGSSVWTCVEGFEVGKGVWFVQRLACGAVFSISRRVGRVGLLLVLFVFKVVVEEGYVVVFTAVLVVRVSLV